MISPKKPPLGWGVAVLLGMGWYIGMAVLGGWVNPSKKASDPGRSTSSLKSPHPGR